MSSSYTKGPGEKLDYTISFSDCLNSETIATVSWQLPSGLTLHAQSQTVTSATAVIGGGLIGASYKVRCRVATSSSPQKFISRHLYISIARR